MKYVAQPITNVLPQSYFGISKNYFKKINSFIFNSTQGKIRLLIGGKFDFSYYLKVREHNKKKRKESKKDEQSKKRKDPGIPNAAPFKEAILKEAQDRKIKVTTIELKFLVCE